MRNIFLAIGLVLFSIITQAQSRLPLSADSVHVKGALIIENASKSTLGFLKNTGNGRTVFSTIGISDITSLTSTLNSKLNVSDTAAMLSPYSLDGHSHVISDVTGLQTAIDGKAALAHTHIIGNISGLQDALDDKSDVGHTHAYSSLTGLPNLALKLNLSDTAAMLLPYALDNHVHAFSDLTGTSNVILSTGSYSNPSWITALAYSKLTGVPNFLLASDTSSLSARINLKVSIADTAAMLSPYATDVDLATKANASHTHAQSDVTNLVSDLAAKVPTSRTLTINGTAYDLSANRSWTIPATDTTSLSNRINLKLNIADTAAMLEDYARQISLNDTAADLRTLIATKANTSHTHVIGDITSLQSSLNAKVNISDTANMLSPYLREIDTASLSSRIDGKQNALSGTGFVKISGSTISYDNSTYLTTASASSTYATIATVNGKVNISDTANMLLPYLRKVDTTSMLAPYLREVDTASLSARINTKVNISDTASMLTPYITQAEARSAISLTTTGTSDAATYNSSTGVLNIPVYSSGSVTLDATPTDGSANGVESNGVFDALALKANTSHNHSGADITSGTISDARLSSNVAFKNAASTTFTGDFFIEQTGGNQAYGGIVNYDVTGRAMWEITGGTTSYSTQSYGESYGGIDSGKVVVVSTTTRGSYFDFDASDTNVAVSFKANGFEGLRIDTLGKLKLPKYTAGFLKSDADGDITATTIAQSDVTNLTSDLAAKQAQLNGTGFVKASGTTITYDNSTYLTTSSAASTYAPIASPTFTGTLAAGTTNIGGKLTVTLTSAQQRWAYDGSNYYESSTASNGAVTFDATGAGAKFTFNDQVNLAGGMQLSGATIFSMDVDTLQIGSVGGVAKNEMIDQLDIQTTSTQLRLGYNSSNGTTLSTGSTGDLTIVPSGGDVFVTGNIDISGTITNTGLTNALAAKAPTASPTFTGTVALPSTTSIGTITSTELGYVDGVTSGIQAQLDLKAPIASPSFTGGISISGASTSNNDIEITDATKGVILKSPNGTRWRLTIGNDGAITATSL